MKSKLRYLLAALLIAVFCAAPAQAKLSSEDAHEVWNKVARATDLTNLPFNVKVDKEPNAWVTNGSSVTVTTSLLDMLDTKDELFCVFAHEAGHAKLGHYNRSVTHGTGLSVATTILGQIFGNVVGTAANVGANLAYAGWSREQEIEADDYAVKLAHEQHMNPVGMYTALKTLSEKAGKTQPSGFNSHPPDERRLPHVKAEIKKYEPNAVFPDEKNPSAVQPKPAAATEAAPKTTTAKPSVTTSTKSKDGHYDIDAALDRMKKEEAAKKTAKKGN